MEQANQKSSWLSVAKNIVIYTAIIEMILRHFFGLPDTYSYILKLEQRTTLPILLIVRLILLLLLICIALSYLQRLYKIAKIKLSKIKTRKQKFKDKIAILNSIKNNPKWRTYSNHKKLNMSEIELIKHINWFVKKQFIEEKVILDRGAKVQTFILRDKGLIFLDKHKKLYVQ